MAVTIFDTATLMGVQQNLKPLNTYWLDLLFPQVQTFDTQFIDFDVVEGGRRIAPFVSPSVQGKVMKNEGFETRRFTPAYLKPKHVVEPNQVFKRMAGETYGGSMSPAQRYEAAVAANMLKERDMITRRLEVMAAEAILGGQVTVTGDNYPTQVIEFGRAAGQTVVKTAGTKWSDAGVDIIADIDTWVNQTQLLSGYAPTRITVTPDVWAVMRVNAGVKDALDTTYRGGAATLDRGVGSGQPFQYKGMLGASLELYVYNDIYENDAGSNVALMPSGSVVLTSSGVEGVRAYGAIQDLGSLQAVEMFPKMWAQEDPSVIFTMTQSAPLTIPTRPNATLKATVL